MMTTMYFIIENKITKDKKHYFTILNNKNTIMENKIKSIQKGYGEGVIFYSTDSKVATKYQVEDIREEAKQVSDNYTINVYHGYIGDKLVFEMGASIDVTVVFW